MGTTTGLSFPSAHAATSFAAALAYRRCGLPGGAALRARRRDGRLARVPRRPLPVGHPRRARCSAAPSRRSRQSRAAGLADGRLADGRTAAATVEAPAVSTRIGIVGMPNAGKSSLFNALTKAGAEAANYPFTTIEPNVAVVPVRDARLEQVAATVGVLGDRLGHDRLPRHRGPRRGRPQRRGARQQIPREHPRDRRDRARRPRPRRRERDPPGGQRRAAARHRDDRGRARARRPRAGRAARRARRQTGARRRQGRGRRGGLAA